MPAKKAKTTVVEEQPVTDLIDEIVAAMHDTGGTENAPQRALSTLLTDFVDKRGKDSSYSGKPSDLIGSCVADLQAKIGRQVSEVLRHPDVRAREASWRGVERLVSTGKPGGQLNMAIQSFRREELIEDMRDCRGNARQSRLFEFLGQDGLFTPGGQPTLMVVLDLAIRPVGEDMELLHFLGQVAEASHQHILVGMSPEFVGATSFATMPSDPSQLQQLWQGRRFAAWRSFRQQSYAKHVGLAMPRWLARQPYGEDNQAPEVEYLVEPVDHEDGESLVWSHASWLAAERFATALRESGWPVAVIGPNSGGKCPALPTVTSQDEDLSFGPMEVEFNDFVSKELANAGFIATSQYQGSSDAVIFAMPSAYDPPNSTDKGFAAAAKLAAELPKGVAVSRFAHMLKTLIREYIGMSESPAQIQVRLEQWLAQYTLARPENAGETIRAKQPLRSATVSVNPVDGDPGTYEAKVDLVPHYQMKQIHLSLRIREAAPTTK